MEEEFHINFGKYIETLVRQWRILFVFVAGAVALAVIVTLFLRFNSPSYQAVVLIASTKTQSDVSFGSAIKTTSEETLAKDASAGAQALYDRKARLQSFVSLVQNGEVAKVVLAQVGPKLKPEERDPSVLMGLVDARLIDATDTIQISVTYSNPEIAAEIANDWGYAYVEHINNLYGSSATGVSYDVITEQTTKSKADYDKAQADLTDFLAKNKAEEYARQIDEIKAIVISLRSARSSAVSAIVTAQISRDQQVIAELYKDQVSNQIMALQQDQEARRQLIGAYIDQLSKGRQEAFSQQVQDRINQLEKAYADLRLVQAFIDNAVTMENAVKQGGDPAATSNALALVLFKTQVYASYTGTNNLQIQNIPESMGADITKITASGMIADLDGVIKTLKTRQTSLTNQITTLSKQLQDGSGITIDLTLDSTGELAKAIQARYPELFTKGKLSELGFTAIDTNNPLEDEAIQRAKDLLSLKGLDSVLGNFSNDTVIEKQIESYEQQMRDLNSLISRANSTQDELTRARDLAWQSYTALASKTTEVAVASQTNGTEVTLASPAIPPDQQVVKIRTSLFVGIPVGILLGIIVAYSYEFWQNYNGKPVKTIYPFRQVFSLLRIRRAVPKEDTDSK